MSDTDNDIVPAPITEDVQAFISLIILSDLGTPARP